jgi:competence protein ComEC
VDDVSVAVRHPPPADWERQDVRNDDSIVMELLWHDVSIVLTGDIGREVEAAIAPLFTPSPLRIVKVPHHGSLTSSSDRFVRALAPRVAIVSVGRHNNFGHPAPMVLQRYRDAGAEIFRTDQDGAVTVDTDGTSLNLHTFTGRRVQFGPTPLHHEGTTDANFITKPRPTR